MALGVSMRALSAIAFIALVATGCATVRDADLREKAVGSWLFDVSVMGERKQELLRLESDGSYTAHLLRTNGLGMMWPITERGTWIIEDGEYSLTAVESTVSDLRYQRRKITKLNDSEWVAIDNKYGIEIRRRRVPNDYVL